jgi:2-oxoglutarate dehydrogenase complex dehydrogenase (E1) component-like enzyme
LRDDTLAEALPFKDGTRMIWAQEEPANQGAWPVLRARFGDKLLGRFPFSGVSRRAASSPATGSSGAHKIEQKQIVDSAFAPAK